MSMIATAQELTMEKAEEIYQNWLKILQKYDAAGLAALYTEDCTLESPLVNRLLNTKDGKVEGRVALNHFFDVLCAQKPPVAERYRTNFSVTGQTMSWEYPRVTPDGLQPDMAEVMDVQSGLIKTHKIYWGWYGLQLLQTDSYGES